MPPQRPDKGLVRSARLLVMKRLEQYDVSAEEVALILGLEVASIRRWTRPPVVRIYSRPLASDLWGLLAPEPSPPPLPSYRRAHDPDLAYQLAMIVLVRAGYAVPVIAKVLGVSPATVYRARGRVDEMQAAPPAWIGRWLERLDRRDKAKLPIGMREDCRQINHSDRMREE